MRLGPFDRISARNGHFEQDVKYGAKNQFLWKTKLISFLKKCLVGHLTHFGDGVNFRGSTLTLAAEAKVFWLSWYNYSLLRASVQHIGNWSELDRCFNKLILSFIESGLRPIHEGKKGKGKGKFQLTGVCFSHHSSRLLTWLKFKVTPVTRKWFYNGFATST